VSLLLEFSRAAVFPSPDLLTQPRRSERLATMKRQRMLPVRKQN